MSLNSHTNFRIKPSCSILGKTSIPGDKSISHRAIILAAIAEGKTRISNFLQGEDTLTPIRIFLKMVVIVFLAHFKHFHVLQKFRFFDLAIDHIFHIIL